MGALMWILVGVIGGWVTSQISGRKDAQGNLVNILVGILGAVAGGFSANLVTMHPVFSLNLSSFIVSVLGVSVFLLVANAVQRQ